MTFDRTVLQIAEVFQQPGEAAYRYANSQGAAFPNASLCVSPGREAIDLCYCDFPHFLIFG